MRNLLLSVPIAWCACPALAERPVELERSHRLIANAAQLFVLAERYIADGDNSSAEAIFRALEEDPNPDIRSEAQFRRARRLLARSQLSEAAVLLRTLVDTRPDATAARLELAHTLDLLDDPDGALRQIRAAQSSGLPANVAALVDRYSVALRARRPAGLSFEIAVAPSTNINRATRSNSLDTIFGDFRIDEDGKAKSGLGLALRGQAYRRISLGGDLSLLSRASGSADLYRQGRFNDLALDLAAGPEFAFGNNRVSLEAGVTQRWFGQKPYVRSARIGATLTRPIGRTTQLRLSGAGSLVDHRVNDLQDGKAISARVAVEHSLSPTLGIGASASGDRQMARDSAYSTKAWRLGLLGWKDLGRMTVTLEGEVGRLRADDRLLLFPEARSDRYSRLAVATTLRQLNFRGFAPVVRVSLERNASTIAFYDYRRLRTEFGISRAF